MRFIAMYSLRLDHYIYKGFPVVGDCFCLFQDSVPVLYVNRAT